MDGLLELLFLLQQPPLPKNQVSPCLASASSLSWWGFGVPTREACSKSASASLPSSASELLHWAAACHPSQRPTTQPHILPPSSPELLHFFTCQLKISGFSFAPASSAMIGQ